MLEEKEKEKKKKKNPHSLLTCVSACNEGKPEIRRGRQETGKEATEPVQVRCGENGRAREVMVRRERRSYLREIQREKE